MCVTDAHENMYVSNYVDFYSKFECRILAIISPQQPTAFCEAPESLKNKILNKNNENYCLYLEILVDFRIYDFPLELLIWIGMISWQNLSPMAETSVGQEGSGLVHLQS